MTSIKAIALFVLAVVLVAAVVGIAVAQYANANRVSQQGTVGSYYQYPQQGNYQYGGSQYGGHYGYGHGMGIGMCVRFW
jgi:hypothetical protein